MSDDLTYMSKIRASILKDLVVGGDSKLAKAVADKNYFVTKVMTSRPNQFPGGGLENATDTYYMIDCDVPFIADNELHVEHSKELWKYFQDIKEWVSE